jgi:SAM-dependent methyltransferase
VKAKDEKKCGSLLERGRELDQIGAPENALERELEKELLSKELTPAQPVGLRYDRLGADACITSTEASRWYSLTNKLLISSLSAHCNNVLVASGEGWLRDLFRSEKREVVRICFSSFVSRVQKMNAAPVETYERLSYRDSSFDGVVVDSSILLSNNVRASLEEFRRILKLGGRICVVAVNWEYEMAGRIETYETSFRRYGSKVYLGLLKRTLSPPKEVEYVCLLDPKGNLAKKLASMEREELRTLSLADVPGATKAVVSAELIEIPQLTRAFLEDVCVEAGFSSVAVSGAPGILALRLFKGVFSSDPASTTPIAGSATKLATALTLFGRSHAVMNDIPRQSGLSRLARLSLFCDSDTVMNDVPQCFACTFPFISSVDNPHIVAVCTR